MPGVDGPNSSGSAMIRSTVSVRPLGCSATWPGAGVSAWVEVTIVIPAASSSPRTASLAAAPNNASGPSSGVTIVIDTSSFIS
jgi:hypothetical protein